MKKIILVIITLLFLLSGYVITERVTIKEQPHIYWKDIDVEVTSIDKRYWYAVTCWYEVEVSVYSEQYQLNHTDVFRGSGIFGCPEQWQYNQGDIVKAELYTWVMDSTGEIAKREIHRVY